MLPVKIGGAKSKLGSQRGIIMHEGVFGQRQPEHNVKIWTFRFPTHRASTDLSYQSQKQDLKVYAAQAGGEVPTCYDLYSVGPGDVPLKKGMCFSRERSLACSRRKKENHLYNVKKSGTTKKKRPKFKSNLATSYLALRFNLSQPQLTSRHYWDNHVHLVWLWEWLN